MGGIRFPQLVDGFASTLERLSATVIRGAVGTRPARMQVITGSAAIDCILFLWTITHGGGERRPDNERRIQLTNVSGIPLEPGRRTLLGGWSEEYGVYAFWDPRRHRAFSSNSPSLQVVSATLENAHRVGVATYIRPAAEGPEVVVAVSPDSLLWYIQDGLPLHNSESDASGVETLADGSPDDERQFIDESQNEIQVSRRYDLVEVMRLYRDAKFRPAVLRAYQYKCAVCQCALKLVDAAHIVPIAFPQSTDEVTNGLALCRLHHGAYDNGLLGVKSDLSVVVNPKVATRLHTLGLDVGLDEFKSRLPGRITVPNSIEARPDPDKLVLGLRARNWPNVLCA